MVRSSGPRVLVQAIEPDDPVPGRDEDLGHRPGPSPRALPVTRATRGLAHRYLRVITSAPARGGNRRGRVSWDGA